MTPRASAPPAKINLCLFLGPARASDGRHELVSVMQSLTLADELTLEPARAARATRSSARASRAPNLAGAALAAFRAATGWDGPPQRADDRQAVPVAAGMGGGSGDAAAALRLAARAAGLAAMRARGARDRGLGADVPAQVRPGRVLATGAGEHVEPFPTAARSACSSCRGRASSSTAAVFREADRQGLARDERDLAGATPRCRRRQTGETYRRDARQRPPARRAALAPEIDEALAAAPAAGADVRW